MVSPEDVVNNALELIGHHNRIASFYDGSPEAIVGRDMWGEVRDALLIRLQPEWARRDIGLTVTKTAPVYGYDEQTPWTPDYPDIPWIYEYAYPEDCLSPLSMKPRAHTLPVWRPKPMRFRVKPNADSTDYVLLGNDPSPILTCIVQMPDTEMWYANFTGIVIETLAKRLMPLFASRAAVQQERQQEQQDANRSG